MGSFEKIYTVEELGNILKIGSGYTNSTSPCKIVRPDFDMVWWPVLWKRGKEYRIFSARLLDKIYQLRKKTNSVVMLWEQGIPVSAKIGEILY
jgi:hypothetical protein